MGSTYVGSGTSKTRLAPGALPGGPLGSFASKWRDFRLTQLSPSALPGQRYGSFAGKTPDAGSGIEVVYVASDTGSWQVQVNGVEVRRFFTNYNAEWHANVLRELSPPEVVVLNSSRSGAPTSRPASEAADQQTEDV